MASTAPDEVRTCTFKVSFVLVVDVSAVSMCNQKLSVARVIVDGMLTCCQTLSVWAEP